MSSLRGYVLDSETEEPIADVAIYGIDANGNRIGVLANADSDGDYQLEYDYSKIKQLEFDLPGYKAFKIDPNFVGSSGKIILEAEAGSELGGVIVKGVKKKIDPKKPNYILPVALGALAITGFCFAFLKKW